MEDKLSIIILCGESCLFFEGTHLNLLWAPTTIKNSSFYFKYLYLSNLVIKLYNLRSNSVPLEISLSTIFFSLLNTCYIVMFFIYIYIYIFEFFKFNCGIWRCKINGLDIKLGIEMEDLKCFLGHFFEKKNIVFVYETYSFRTFLGT
jgi:hypothetical protein